MEWALASRLAGALGAAIIDPRGEAEYKSRPPELRDNMRWAARLTAEHILEQEKLPKASLHPILVGMPPTAAGRHGDPRDIIVTWRAGIRNLREAEQRCDEKLAGSVRESGLRRELGAVGEGVKDLQERDSRGFHLR